MILTGATGAQRLAAARRIRDEGGPDLAALPDDALRAAWSATVAAFADPGSSERAALADRLARSARLSPAGLDAALATVLNGVRAEVAERLLTARAEARADRGGRPPRHPAGAGVRSPLDLILLASNLPGLAVQPLLRSLVERRPAVLKSSSAEPHFVPAFVAALERREPRLGRAILATGWRGGDRRDEDGLFALAGRVIAYGGAAAMRDLETRLGPAVATGDLELWRHGPKTSVALLDLEGVPTAEEAAIAADLARDVALFDQRGCLSVTSVAVCPAPRAEAFARRLAVALGDLARRWPPGPAALADQSGARLFREAALAAGRPIVALDPLGAGAVAVWPAEHPRRWEPSPGPGLRSVAVAACDALEQAVAALAALRGAIQGVALSVPAARETAPLRGALRALGVSRIAPPGLLQAADASWDDADVMRAGGTAAPALPPTSAS